MGGATFVFFFGQSSTTVVPLVIDEADMKVPYVDMAEAGEPPPL